AAAVEGGPRHGHLVARHGGRRQPGGKPGHQRPAGDVREGGGKLVQPWVVSDHHHTSRAGRNLPQTRQELAGGGEVERILEQVLWRTDEGGGDDVEGLAGAGRR